MYDHKTKEREKKKILTQQVGGIIFGKNMKIINRSPRGRIIC